MIPITSYSGKSVAVFGLGMSGLGTARALEAGGAVVSCWDDGEAGRAKAAEAGFNVVDLNEADWSGFSSLILAPGVPLTHPVPHWTVTKALDAGVEVIGDTELFFREHKALGSKAKLIGITGTNGKSTTTALVAHLLASAGRDVEMGGNIGKAVLDLEPFADDRVYVIEFSSYQIDLTPSMHLDAAALLNVTPDHIDRHGTVENYAGVKEHIFQNMHKGQTAVIGVDDIYCQEIASRLYGDFEVQHISVVHDIKNGIRANDGVLYSVRDGETSQLVSLLGVNNLRGSHNWQNAAVAYALVQSVGVSAEDIAKGFETFPGLAHRMQEIARDGAIVYVNDSKATNADAAAKALSSYEEIYWIAGGVAKDGGIDSLKEYFPRIVKAYLIGQAGEDFSQVLEGKVPFELSGTIEQAVKSASLDAKVSQGVERVILLSPACASFDQYPNFAVRGDDFCRVVEGLR